MLSRSHGQTASPTTCTTTIYYVVTRLQPAGKRIHDVKDPGKICGEVCNYTPHLSATTGHALAAFSND